MNVTITADECSFNLRARVIEIPPHFRTLKLLGKYEYCQLPYTQFYFTDIAIKEWHRIFTMTEFESETVCIITPLVLVTNTTKSYRYETPKCNIFPNSNFNHRGYMDFPAVCFGRIKFKDYEDKTIMNEFWNSSFGGLLINDLKTMSELYPMNVTFKFDEPCHS